MDKQLQNKILEHGFCLTVPVYKVERTIYDLTPSPNSASTPKYRCWDKK